MTKVGKRQLGDATEESLDKRFTMNYQDLVKRIPMLDLKEADSLEDKGKRFTMNIHDLEERRGDDKYVPQKRFTMNHEDLMKRGLLTPIELNRWMLENWARTTSKPYKRFTMNYHDLEGKPDEVKEPSQKRFTMNYQDLLSKRSFLHSSTTAGFIFVHFLRSSF